MLKGDLTAASMESWLVVWSAVLTESRMVDRRIASLGCVLAEAMVVPRAAKLADGKVAWTVASKVISKGAEQAERKVHV